MRAIRYEIIVVRADGSDEVVQASSRRVDAAKRAQIVARDRKGWPSVVKCFVRDSHPQMIDGKFINIVASFERV